MPKILLKSYFLEQEVLYISQDLLGKVLVCHSNEGTTAGMITETEAYRGPEDKASHAYLNRRTRRNESMFLEGGTAYVYLCYGMYPLFNIVTNRANIPHAVLIRSIEPLEGIPLMLHRRQSSSISAALTSGPGRLTQAMGISMQHNGQSLLGPYVQIEDCGIHFATQEIISSPRIDVAYAQEDALLPWRFYIKNNSFVSRLKQNQTNRT